MRVPTFLDIILIWLTVIKILSRFFFAITQDYSSDGSNSRRTSRREGTGGASLTLPLSPFTHSSSSDHSFSTEQVDERERERKRA